MLVSCSQSLVETTPDAISEPINSEYSINKFFIGMGGDTLENFYKIKNLNDVNSFLRRYNIDVSILEARTSCTNGMCSKQNQMVGEDLFTFFNLPSSEWTERSFCKKVQKTVDQYGLNIKGAGILMFIGGGACPITDGTALLLAADPRKKYYLHGINEPHFCEAGNPIPIVTNYSGTTMISVDPCAGYSDAVKYTILKSSLFKCIPIMTSEDIMSGYLPGVVWDRYGKYGYGSPDGDIDAQRIAEHASTFGAL